jgi:hypothetical protein
VHEILFLTRPGCSQSPYLHGRLYSALHATGIGLRPVIVDVGDLPSDDPRTGYGTPTILVDGQDLFGAPVPKPAGPT